MPRALKKKERGVYERITGSGVWWIRYKQDGIDHREKVGTRGNAIKLYALRRAAVIEGIKLPANLRHKAITIEQIGQVAIEWYRNHGRRDLRTFSGRMNIIIDALGSRPASDLTPGQIDSWLSSHNDWTAATKNRYKTVLSKAFQLALIDGKVKSNPARLVAHRAEQNARIRFLLPDEELRLRKAIRERCPDQMAALDIALHTGMRKSEQFNLEWSQVSLERKTIHLEITKNGSSRTIPMSPTCFRVLTELWKKRARLPEEKRNDFVFQSSRYPQRLLDPKKWFEYCIDKSKVTNFRWHDLRHTFISRLVMKGVDLRIVQELAGHKTINMTVRYSHLAPEHNQSAIDKLG